MLVKQIQNLLQKSGNQFQKRELKDALHMAKQALDLANDQTNSKAILQSNLLIGQIYTVSGRFESEQSHFHTALDFLEKAKAVNETNANGQTVQLYLAYGNVYQNQNRFDLAEKYFDLALQHAKANKDKQGTLRSLCALSDFFITKKGLDQALAHIQEALELIDDTTSIHQKIEVYNQLCQVYIKKQEYSNVLNYGKEALEFSRQANNVEQELIALNNMAVYYGVQADYKQAMTHLLDALEKSKAINYRLNTAQSLINIATIYASLYNYREATNRYQTVLEEYEGVIDDYTHIIVLNNLGNVFYHSDDPQKALESFEKAYQLSSKINYKEMIAHSLAQKGRANAALKDFDLALSNAEQAQVLIEELGDINGKQINLVNFGNIYYHKKDFDRAIKVTSQGIVAAKRMKDDENEIRGYQILAKIYQELKDFEKALDYQLVYSKAQERFAKEQRNRQVLDLEIQFAIRQKQKEIFQLTKENEYQALLLEQSDQIAHQNDQLLQANEDLRQFAYVASHDLKEPLRMIGSYTQLIERRFKDQINEDNATFFHYVKEGVERMNNLLDALLRYATIGKSEFELEKVNLNDVVDLCKINLDVAIEETETDIKVTSDLPEIDSVQSLLIQLIQNLLSNAIKFRKPNQPAVIKIYHKEEEHHHHIFVEDNGIGINPEFQERIFIIFQRLHTRSQYDGTGIGLAICQKIVQRLGGAITVKSELGEGALFSFSLPK